MFEVDCTRIAVAIEWCLPLRWVQCGFCRKNFLKYFFYFYSNSKRLLVFCHWRFEIFKLKFFGVVKWFSPDTIFFSVVCSVNHSWLNSNSVPIASFEILIKFSLLRDTWMFPCAFTPQTFASADAGGALFLNRYFPVISINVVKRNFLFAPRTNVSMNSIMPNARNEQCIQQPESEKLFAIKSRRIEIFCFRFSELNLCFHALLCWCFNWFSFQRSEMQFIMNEKDSKISAFLMKPLRVLCCDFWWKLSTVFLF